MAVTVNLSVEIESAGQGAAPSKVVGLTQEEGGGEITGEPTVMVIEDDLPTAPRLSVA